MDEKEKQLIKGIKSGKEDAIRKMINKYGERLMQYINSIINDVETSKDIFQITWIKVMERIDTFDEKMPFSPWLFRIARNCAYDFLKRESRKVSLEANRGVIPCSMEKFTQNIENEELIKKIVDKLGEKHREIIFLRFFEEKSYLEISKILNIPEGTVKSRLKRALDEMIKIHQKLSGE